ncbi:MAG: hypothetical protein HFJ25_06605, partial [Clostridia bacterium]|nr:hypothetical protein [Clostridia bacterium]
DTVADLGITVKAYKEYTGNSKVELQKGDNVGSNYPIKGESTNANYNVTFTDATYSITARNVTVALKDDTVKTSVYGDAIVTYNNDSLTATGLAEGDTVADLGMTVKAYKEYTETSKVELQKGDNVGANYPIKGESTNTNYNVTFTDATYSITAKSITVAIRNTNKLSSVYKAEINSFEIDDYIVRETPVAPETEGTEITGTEKESLQIEIKAYKTYTDAEKVLLKAGDPIGTNYPVKAICKNTNYAIDFIEPTYSITAKQVNLDGFSILDKEVMYDGTAKAIDIPNKLPEGVTGISFIYTQGDTTVTSPKDVGTYTATVQFELDSNYSAPVIEDEEIIKATLKITARPVTVTLTKDAVKTSVYGDAIATYGENDYIVSGLAEGDTVADLGITVKAYKEYTGNSKVELQKGDNVGANYPIKGESTNTNYNVTFTDATYEITARNVTVSLVDTAVKT